MVNIAIIMVVLRCASRSIVLKNALRSLSRCTLSAGQKQKPQKVESKALHDQQNSNGANIALFMGVLFALHQKPNKTKAEQMQTFPDCFKFSQRHDSRSRSPRKTQAADSLLFFAAFNRKRAAILKPSLFQKTLHQIAQYITQYSMQFFTVYFSDCSCISGYYVVYFNQDKEKHNNSEA